jgi:hypothetical protein
MTDRSVTWYRSLQRGSRSVSLLFLVHSAFTTECTKDEWLICIGLFDQGRFAPSERSVSVITLMAQDGRLAPGDHGCRK